MWGQGVEKRKRRAEGTFYGGIKLVFKRKKRINLVALGSHMSILK